MVLEKGFLRKPLINLAFGWELYTITKAVAIAIIIAVFGTVYII